MLSGNFICASCPCWYCAFLSLDTPTNSSGSHCCSMSLLKHKFVTIYKCIMSENTFNFKEVQQKRFINTWQVVSSKVIDLGVKFGLQQSCVLRNLLRPPGTSLGPPKPPWDLCQTTWTPNGAPRTPQDPSDILNIWNGLIKKRGGGLARNVSG